ncbi:MAG TPA: hypothetical protein DEG17_19880 [Cyanobacteria bacterium UBA11149]|nr:hypothetical protein [Cyanobacteria bacterium UBA11367]HBE56492.1 hypothetical protein [Cyanobacteria bacterium UBA11366]HBK64949.1 hypothetical protein [Cyanobacteria bacterium UBA11166]HBR76965.1 hypothetical protein [Cyanobacteria bacterium UBA11159]HBS71966.1 hypothetical protein [Cyanobacteria bacterium UBA11153]HBW91059.1 hypothetical protein [Cyanobacteria bacterium UBA11149]HCA97843.1 hypothetical protein [Cyanobacteria bacterium UBA9226]
MKPTDELRHLFSGEYPEERGEDFAIIWFNVICPGNADRVLKNCREVLAIVLRQYEKNWLSENEWREVLPRWFVESCAPECREEDYEENLANWQTLSREEQIREIEEELWSMMEWISWFDPADERYWFWWDAVVKDPNLLLVTVEVVDCIYPSGSLAWLLRASGAIKVE